jgi:hypothetical protein
VVQPIWINSREQLPTQALPRKPERCFARHKSGKDCFPARESFLKTTGGNYDQAFNEIYRHFGRRRDDRVNHGLRRRDQGPAADGQ